MLKRTITFLLVSLSIFSISTKSTKNTFASNYNIGFEPSCESILLLNLDSDCVVYSKNPDKKMAPASITKIMTYIVTSEHVNDIEHTNVTIKKAILDKLLGTGSSLSGIKANETLNINQLLHCMMIKSGNDAALVLADFIGNGNIETFVTMMNEKAKELNCNNTHFTNPHGLYDENHYTTASDLIKITKYAMTLPGFTEITSKVTSDILGSDRYPLVTTNSLIDPVRGGKYYYKYAKGIKTGFDTLAGRCLVSSASNNGYTYICIALGGFSETENQAMLDSKALYQWAFNNLALKPIIDKNKPVGEVKLNFAWKKDTLQLFPATDYSAMLPKGVMPSSIDVKMNVPNSINATVKAGQKVGTATLSYANNEIATINLVSEETINRNYFLFISFIIRSIFSSIWFKIAFFLFLVLATFYVFMFFKYNKIKKKRKHRKSKKFRYK